MSMLGIKHGSIASAASAVNHQAVSAAPIYVNLKNKFYNIYILHLMYVQGKTDLNFKQVKMCPHLRPECAPPERSVAWPGCVHSRPDFLFILFSWRCHTLVSTLWPASSIPLGADMNSNFRSLAVVWAVSAVRVLPDTVYTMIHRAPDSWQCARW